MDLKNGSKTIKHSDNVLEFITKDKEFEILWFADSHLDSDKSKSKWIKDTINDNPDAFIIMGGDNHDLMHGKHDRRGSKSSLKPEQKRSDYWNALIEQSRKEWIEPYKDRIIVWNTGNHESSCLIHNEIDFLGWLTADGNGERLYTSGYIVISYFDNSRDKSVCFPIYFQHAPPSGGKRSKGMLSVDLLLAQHPDANAIISEHIHETFITPQTVERFSVHNKTITYRNVWYLQAPTTKAEHEGKKIGFFHEKIKKSSTTIGCLKLKFKFIRNKENRKRLLTLTPEYILHYD